MKRTVPALILLFCAGAAMLAVGAWVAVPPRADKGAASQPDVVLLVIDALRADRPGARRNGQPVTPFLDEFGKGALVFTNAIAQSSWTRPSMATLFTSLHLDAHQAYHAHTQEKSGEDFGDVLSPQLETLAEFLKASGYRTAAVQTNGNLTRETGFAQGFDSYDYFWNAPAAQITDAAIKVVNTMGDKGPRFLYVHYMDPHLPFVPPESHRALLGWPLKITPEETAIVTDFLDYSYDYIECAAGLKPPVMKYPQLSETGCEAVRLLYDAEIRYADEQAGRLMRELRQKWPNAMVIITADHGEHLWDHKFLGHVLTLYDELTRVPLMVSAPGLSPGRTDKPVGLVDLMPSVAEQIGVPPEPWWQGRSVFGQIPANRALFSHTLGDTPRFNISMETAQQGPFKLIVDHKRENADQLYDLAADPHELVNMAAQRPDVVEKLRKLLDAHRVANKKARRGARERVLLDTETLQQQRQLGYGR